ESVRASRDASRGRGITSIRSKSFSGNPPIRGVRPSRQRRYVASKKSYNRIISPNAAPEPSVRAPAVRRSDQVHGLQAPRAAAQVAPRVGDPQVVDVVVAAFGRRPDVVDVDLRPGHRLPAYPADAPVALVDPGAELLRRQAHVAPAVDVGLRPLCSASRHQACTY